MGGTGTAIGASWIARPSVGAMRRGGRLGIIAKRSREQRTSLGIAAPGTSPARREWPARANG